MEQYDWESFHAASEALLRASENIMTIVGWFAQKTINHGTRHAPRTW